MFYESAQTIGPGWHGKSFKPSHYDDMSWPNANSVPRHFRSPGSSPTIRRRIINHDDEEDDSEPHMFPRRSPTFDRRFFKDVWDDRSMKEDMFADRPRMFKRATKDDWDKKINDFEESIRRDRDFRDGYGDPEDETSDGLDSISGRIHHIPIMVERRRGRTNDDRPRRTRGTSSPPSSPPPSSASEQQDYVDESDEWLRRHMNRLKQNFDSGFSTLQNRHGRHRLPRVDINNRPRAFTSPIPDWGPESVHTLPTRKHHKVVVDEKRTPKSVFRSYSETHEDIPREHPTASRSHSDSHCPKTTYVTKVSVNVPSETKEDDTPREAEECPCQQPVPPQRRTRYRPRKEEGSETEQDINKPSSGKSETTAVSSDQNESQPNAEPNGEPDAPKIEVDDEPKMQKTSSKVANALLQISAVLQNVEDLFRHVEAYSGNGRDKQFRFLDEMLTRCMLRLDDVDTDGLEDVRSARRAAVRQVHACIEKLESRASGENGKEDARVEPGNKTGETVEMPKEESKPSSEETMASASGDDEPEQTRL